jgi:hypothetical protein
MASKRGVFDPAPFTVGDNPCPQNVMRPIPAESESRRTAADGWDLSLVKTC